MMEAPPPAVAAVQAAQPAATRAPALRQETLFVIDYVQGPKWIADQPMQRQPLLPHFQYMQSLLRKGVLVGGGPIAATNAGMALIRATDFAAANAILAADPAIVSGIFTATIREWNVRVGD